MFPTLSKVVRCGLPFALLGLVATAAWAGPRATVAEPRVDLGLIPKGDVVDHLFTIANPGDETLVISGARSSCGCTVTAFDSEIPAGGSGTVQARVDTRSVTGSLETVITVETSDPSRRQLRLELAARVEPSLGAAPGGARWNTVETETRGTLGVTVWALDGLEFEVHEVVVTNPHVTASFRAATESERYPRAPGPQWRVELTLGDDPPLGAIAGFAEIRTSHPIQEKVHIPLSGFVRPLTFVDPQAEDIGPVRVDRGTRRASYQVRNFGTTPMTIEQAMVGLDWLTVSVDPIEPGFIYKIVVEFDPERVPDGPFATTVEVHTDLAARPVIRWPLRGTVVRDPTS